MDSKGLNKYLTVNIVSHKPDLQLLFVAAGSFYYKCKLSDERQSHRSFLRCCSGVMASISPFIKSYYAMHALAIDISNISGMFGQILRLSDYECIRVTAILSGESDLAKLLVKQDNK
jgi:hypothetical protein